MPRTIEIVPYDDKWVDLYEYEKGILQNIFGDLIIEVHHFGSTSIKGISAKPIIDIMVFVKDINIVDNFNQQMINSGYVVRGENGEPGRRYFVRLKDDNSGNHT